jgi:hypothetical protein
MEIYRNSYLKKKNKEKISLLKTNFTHTLTILDPGEVEIKIYVKLKTKTFNNKK